MKRLLLVAALALVAPATARALDEEERAVIAEFCAAKYGGDYGGALDCRDRQATAAYSIFNMLTVWGRNPTGQAKVEREIMFDCGKKWGLDFETAIDCFVKGVTADAELRKQGRR
jgi:hypothetical protein